MPNATQLLEGVGRLEHYDAAGRYQRFFTGPGIAAHALAFLAHDKGAERRQLYRLATLKAVSDFFEHKLKECGAFGSRQADLLVERLTQIRSVDRLARHWSR
jgi:hypothetical protein